MKNIDGIITDRKPGGEYLSFSCLAPIGFSYSSDIQNGTDVRVYIKELPKFNELYDYFMLSKSILFLRNKSLDICLSLFYDPYFTDFYKKLRIDIKISKQKVKYLKKYFLDYLANPYHYHNIVEENLCGDDLRNFYLEKDIYNKSKELLELLT